MRISTRVNATVPTRFNITRGVQTIGAAYGALSGLRSLWSCKPPVHLRHDPRSAEYVALERCDPEARLREQRIDWTVYIAAATNAAKPPERVQTVLELCHPWIGAAPMLQEGVKHPPGTPPR